MPDEFKRNVSKLHHKLNMLMEGKLDDEEEETNDEENKKKKANGCLTVKTQQKHQNRQGEMEQSQ